MTEKEVLDINQRNEMTRFHSDQEAFDSWVNRLAFVYHKPVAAVLEWSMVKEEKMEYSGDLQ